MEKMETVKQWNKIKELWIKCDVPPVMLKEFEIGVDFVKLPWYSITRKEQIFYIENPLQQTAFHLAVFLRDKDIDLIIAYKIYAFLRYNRLNSLFIDTLSYVMSKYDIKLYDWWNLNSIYVLPDCPFYYNFEKKLTDKDWSIIVKEAANTWKTLAKEWQIIRIPDFMDSDSEEYKAYMNYSEQKSKENRYKEYLILKDEFENK
jgi:hypothetical protein